MLKRNQFMSAITPLIPTSIIDTKTGEYVTPETLAEKLGFLTKSVREETLRLYEEYKEELPRILENYSGTPNAAEFARQKGYKTSFRESLPREILGKSRLEKLVQFKLISEVGSYVKNTDPEKQEPTISWALNLGAVDKQLASLSLDGEELNLLFKCWDTEYYITFKLPAYVFKKRISKFTLPVIRYSKKRECYVFGFSVVEEMKPRKGWKHTAGIDLGRMKPYSMAIVNQEGSRVAGYEASPRLTRLSQKRDRLIKETQHITARVENRAKRGLASPVHEVELERVTAKATRLTTTVAQQLGAEVAARLNKHNSNLLHVEDLSWVSGSKEAKIGSSRWAHAQQQEAITHSVKRIGYKTRSVSERNTSQSCHKCGEKVTHNHRSRTVWCEECRSRLDRDFNAAMNIAKRNSFPVSKKLNGGTTGDSGVDHGMVRTAFSGTLVPILPLVARKTT